MISKNDSEAIIFLDNALRDEMCYNNTLKNILLYIYVCVCIFFFINYIIYLIYKEWNDKEKIKN